MTKIVGSDIQRFLIVFGKKKTDFDQPANFIISAMLSPLALQKDVEAARLL